MAKRGTISAAVEWGTLSPEVKRGRYFYRLRSNGDDIGRGRGIGERNLCVLVNVRATSPEPPYAIQRHGASITG